MPVGRRICTFLSFLSLFVQTTQPALLVAAYGVYRQTASPTEIYAQEASESATLGEPTPSPEETLAPSPSPTNAPTQPQLLLGVLNTSSLPSWSTVSWTTPSLCATDPAGETSVSPANIDLVGDATQPAVAYGSDGNFRYFRERLSDSIIKNGKFEQAAWVVLFQIGQPKYQYLATLNGKKDKVELYSNSSVGSDVDFDPLFNDPAEEPVIWSGNASEYANAYTVDGRHYAEWAVPLTVFEGTGVTDSTAKYFATSSDANNYNKDHLNCYNSMADLGIVKSDSADPIYSGGSLTYTLTITNFGPDTASNVTVSDPLPSGFAVSSITPSSGGTCGDVTPPDIACTFSSLANGATATVTINGTLTGSTTVTNTTQVSSDTLDPNQGNNSDSETTSFNPYASITVVKDAQPNSPQAFSFTTTGTGLSNFSLDDNNDPALPSTRTFSGLLAGTYTITEEEADDWSLQSIACSANGAPVGTVSERTVTLEATIGQQISCTFTNQRDAGTITVIKNVEPNANTQWQMAITGPSPYNQTLTGDASTGALTAYTGGYSISESGTRSLDYSSAYECTKDGTAYMSGSGMSISNITVEKDNDVVCTFTNTIRRGRIIIEKQTNPAGDTTEFTFTGEVLSGAISDNEQIEVSDLLPGTYTTTETVPTGWTLDQIDCDDTNSLENLTDQTAAVVLDPGETVKCTFTNIKYPTITVNKVLWPTGDPGRFDLLLDGEVVAGNIGNGGSSGARIVDIGKHTIGEEGYGGTVAGNYTTTYSDNCAGGEVTVGAGEDASCTITNSRKGSYITFDKVVSGGSALDSQWSFQVLNGGTFVDGEFTWFPTGTYTVTESTGSILGSQYTATEVRGACSNLSGNSATLTVTETNGTCTFVNTRDTGTVRVNKLVDTDGDGSYDSSNAVANALGFRWGLDSSSINREMGTSNTTVETGSHSIHENDGSVDNYHFTGWYNTAGEGSCTDPDGTTLPITISVGKDVTTEITLCNARDTASLTVRKDVVPNDDSFWSFTLFDGANNPYGTPIILGDGQSRTTGNLPTGSYTITESTDPNYSTSASCSNEVTGGDSVNLTLSRGQRVSCTFTNTRKTGSVTVDKVTNPGQDTQEFRFNLYKLGQTTPLASVNLSDTSAAKVFDSLLVGQYELEEVGVPGWDLDEIDCNVEFTRNRSRASFSLTDSGVSCTFTNTKRGIIVAHNFTDKNADGLESNGDGNEAYWNMRLFQGQNCTGEQLASHQTSAPPEGNVRFDNLIPGTYWVREDLINSSWTHTTSSCQSVTVPAGVTVYVDFGNFFPGSVLGMKYEDKNGNGSRDAGENGLDGWTIYIDANTNEQLDAGELSATTATDGSYRIDGLLYGTYQVREVNQGEWRQTAPAAGSHTIDVVSSTYATNKDFGNYRNAIVRGEKFNDIDGDGFWGETEPSMQKWQIFIDKDNNGILDDGEIWTSTSNEGYTFYLSPGTYRICEVQQPEWQQTAPIRGCHTITTMSGDNIAGLNFGNQEIHPSLTISKSHDKEDQTLAAGSALMYTITLKLNGNRLHGLEVTDLLPYGFTYRKDSWKVTSSIHGSLNVGEPTYASPGKWSIPYSMEPEEVITLSYVADISDSTDPGTYKDVVWAYGCPVYMEGQCSTGEDGVLAQAVDSDYISGNFAGTETRVISDDRAGGSVDIEKEGEVLGASTVRLPATGAGTTWLVIAVLLFAGASLITTGKRKEGMKMLLIMLLGLSFLAPKASAADPKMVVRVEEPKSPTRDNSFSLSYTVLDLEGRPSIDMNCFVKKPGESGYIQFGTATTMVQGGNSGSCSVTDSVISKQGTYQFYVTAAAGSETVQSETIAVEYDTEGPGNPTDYRKEHPSTCRYVIKFRTADDNGKTVRAELFRSTETNFNLDSGTRVGSLDIGSKTEGEFINDLPHECDKTYHYVLRAYDSAGNASGSIGDEVTKITTITGKTEEVGALLVSTGSNGGSILGTSSEEESGEVQGESSESLPQPETIVTAVGRSMGKAIRQPAIWLALIVLGAGILLIRRGKKRTASQ